MRNLWWKEENWPTLKKALEIRRNPEDNGLCDEDPVPRMKVINCLQRIGNMPITFNNESTPGKQDLLLQNQVKYVEDIIVTREMANLGMSRQEVIQTISDIGQDISYVQA